MEGNIKEGQIIKDITEVVPGPHTKIAQVAIVWTVEMASQPNGFMVGDEELAQAIADVEALVATVKVANDNLDEDDEDIEDGMT